MNNEWLKLQEVAELERASRQTISWRLNTKKYPTEQVKHKDGKWYIHYDALSEQAKEKYWQKYGRLIQNQEQEEKSEIEKFHALAQAGAMDKKTELQYILFKYPTGYYDKIIIAKELGVSIKTLYYWLKKGKITTPNRNLPKILRGRRGRLLNEGVKYDATLRLRAVELYAQPYQPTSRQVWEQLCYEIGEAEKPSLRQVQRWIRKAELEKPAEICYLRKGEKRWADKYAPSLRRNWDEVPAGDTYVGDHHEFDCFVVGPDGRIQRPWFTAWMDGHSRALVGYTINFQPCAMEIALALGKAIFPDNNEEVPWQGLPNNLYVDNGKDYKSHLLNGEVKSIYKPSTDEKEWGLIQELGITMRYAQRYHAQSKHIERFFGTFEGRWINMLPGWCGRNTKERPEHLKDDIKLTQEWLESGGTKGEQRLLLWWEFEEEIAIAIQEYNNSPHSSLNGLSPVQAYEIARLKTVKMPAKDTYELLILPSATRKIQTDGIHFSYKGDNRIYTDPALWGKEGQSVEIRYNPHDLREIIVLQGAQYICKAKAIDEVPPFAEDEEQKNALSAFLEGRGALRKEYLEKRKEITAKDPRLYPKPVVGRIRSGAQEVIASISRYDQAGKEVKQEGTTKAGVESRLVLFRYQQTKKS